MVNSGERVMGVACTDDKLIVDLEDGRTISVPLVWYPRLLHALPSQRHNWEPAGGGFGIHWPEIDEDLSGEGLLRGAPAPAEQSSRVQADPPVPGIGDRSLDPMSCDHKTN